MRVLFRSGDAFGRLLLTRYLGADLGDPAFRGRNDALLSKGESVHTLQRASYSGPIGARHGRTPEQMAAISSGLTLLTNVIMTWNATRIGEVRARMPDTFPDHHIMHIAPNAHEHINTKGVITIDVSPHRDRSEEHTSELQSLMRISYAVFCLKKKNTKQQK